MTVLPTIPRPGVDAGVVSEHSSGEVSARARRRTFTGAYKLRVVTEYEAATPGERGAVLRREGLYSSRRVIEVQRNISALLEDLSKRAHDGSGPPTSARSSPPRSSK